MAHLRLTSSVLAACAAVFGLMALVGAALPAQPPPVAIDADDIGGVVTRSERARGGRLGHRRDARPRRALHQERRHRRCAAATSCRICPPASYQVWARGYGLVDSARSTSRPGQQVNITAVPAPSPAAAAEYYPAIYWYSMLTIPGAGEFGTHPGISKNITQTAWLDGMKSNGCVGCHQLGQKSTRTDSCSLRHVQPRAPMPGAGACRPASRGR